MKVSIVIATYNRARLLGETLHSLCKVLDCDYRVDIIVINNNSTDNTQSTAESFKATLPELRVVIEKHQGLSYARNCGVRLSDSDLVVFLDDDVEVAPDWLPKLLSPFEDPEVAVSGGKVLPFGMQKLPDWLPREYGFLASVFDPFDLPCDINNVMGANFAVRKSIFDTIGFFDVNLGRKGAKLLGGEEVDLFHRIRNHGFRITYTPDSIVWHKISDKLNVAYIEDYAYWLGVSEALIDKKLAIPLKYPAKLLRSIFFPSTFYALQKMFAQSDASAAMRYIIKRNYARGYLTRSSGA